ncbi:hypothetical protein D3C71_1478860 [compost metagenome]
MDQRFDLGLIDAERASHRPQKPGSPVIANRKRNGNVRNPMFFFEYLGRFDSVCVRDDDVQNRSAGFLQVVERLSLTEEGVRLEAELLEQSLQHTEIALPEHILHGDYSPEINRRRILDRGLLYKIPKQRLQHQLIAIIRVAFEADRLRCQHRQVAVLVALDYRPDIIADHLNHAARDNKIQISVHHLQRVDDLLVKPAFAAEHDVAFGYIGARQRLSAAIVASVVARSAAQRSRQVPAAAR